MEAFFNMVSSTGFREDQPSVTILDEFHVLN